MIQYFDDGDLACFDGLSFRRDKRTGYYLNAKTHKRLHKYVWEYFNGEVPEGYHVHHIDGDKTHNEIENLALMEKSEHVRWHNANMTDERKIAATDNLAQNAMPKAREWHQSVEGREWHKRHYEQYKELFNKRQTCICAVCGKEFEGDAKSKYCSNNCKAAARRASGVDNEERRCAVCGKVFYANKYSKQKTCSRECGGAWRKSHKD